jgi:release factor glutamine methyltransferase
VKLLKGDLFEGLKSLELEGKIDMVVSNPPYIARIDIEDLQEEVKHEPIEALNGGEDGLKFYKKIIPSSKKYLKKGGKVVLEIGYDQRESVSQIFEEENYEAIEVVKDLQGHDRVVIAEF